MPVHRSTPRSVVLAVLACALLALSLAVVAPAAAAPTPLSYGQGDLGGGGSFDVLPPGTAGTESFLQLLLLRIAGGPQVPHSSDQLAAYSELPKAAPGLKTNQIGRFYGDSTFGVKAGDTASQESPRPDVTITRDKGRGIPHVYGSDRQGVMFGAGYANAEDRLFVMDALRHVGRAELASLAGGSPGNRSFDAQVWTFAPYTEADLQRQFDQASVLYGAAGAQVQQDVRTYLDGINAYIAKAKAGTTTMPGEYAALGHPEGPAPFQPTDLVAIAGVVGSQFGSGGGNELGAVQVLQSFQKRFGDEHGMRLWRQMMAYEDPDAPTTVKPEQDAIDREACAARPPDLPPAKTRSGRRRRAARCDGKDGKRSATWFPYQRPLKTASGVGKGEVLPDPGSVRTQPVIVAGPDAESPARSAARPRARVHAASPPAALDLGIDGLGGALSGAKHAMSNALLVSSADSATGKPLAVFGPQVSYFSPQILVQEELQGGGVSARGAAFPGIGMYVELGRGPDYAWSATSGGGDVTDTFAVPLCEPGGGAPSTRSMSYEYQGACLPIETLSRTESWNPSLGDATPAGSETFQAQRTKLGIVRGRGTVKGKPYAFTSLRSTYMHEADSALGFSLFNQPAKVHDAQSFFDAAAKVNYTFNWFYADDRDTGYFSSGWDPLRAPDSNGQLPIRADHPWQGYVAGANESLRLPDSDHPQVINQDYTTSWNNKQAPGFAGADTQLFSSVYRSSLLDRQLDLRLAHGDRKISKPELVDAMSVASTTDLRGQEDVPLALDVIGDVSKEDPVVRGAVADLRSWQHDGWHRRDRDGDGHYEHSAAVRVMDAWWPLWVRSEFSPTLGAAAYQRLTDVEAIDNPPNNEGQHRGSAYQQGWYGYVSKDLRALLGRPLHQRYDQAFCGGGDRATCRRVLIDSLRRAAKQTTDQVYPRDAICSASDAAALDPQWCYDAIQFRPFGGITQPLIGWQNRPTYQQVIGFTKHRPR